MPTSYRLTQSCGHTRFVESDTVPTAKAPSCGDCPPDPKYGKVQRPVVLVEVLDQNGDFVKVDRPDLPTVPRSTRRPTPSQRDLVAALEEAIRYVDAFRDGADVMPDTPLLDAVAALWATPVQVEAVGSLEDGKATIVPVAKKAPKVDLSSVSDIGDLAGKLQDALVQVEADRDTAEGMSRRACLAFLTDRGVAGVSRKPVAELRDLVRAELGLSRAS